MPLPPFLFQMQITGYRFAGCGSRILPAAIGFSDNKKNRTPAQRAIP